MLEIRQPSNEIELDNTLANRVKAKPGNSISFYMRGLRKYYKDVYLRKRLAALVASGLIEIQPRKKRRYAVYPNGGK